MQAQREKKIEEKRRQRGGDRGEEKQSRSRCRRFPKFLARNAYIFS